MDTIPFHKWTPDPHDPGRQVYAGQRTAQEVFGELKYRLEYAVKDSLYMNFYGNF